MPTNLEQVPEPFDPQELGEKVKKVTKELDDLESVVGAPVPRELHDVLQDGVMKIIATLQTQVASLAFYMSAHEDRISEIEEGDGSQLLAEDAEPIIAYLQRCVEIFEKLLAADASKYPGLDEMVRAGKDMAAFLDQITIPDEGDDEDAPEPNVRH